MVPRVADLTREKGWVLSGQVSGSLAEGDDETAISIERKQGIYVCVLRWCSLRCETVGIVKSMLK